MKIKIKKVDNGFVLKMNYLDGPWKPVSHKSVHGGTEDMCEVIVNAIVKAYDKQL